MTSAVAQALAPAGDCEALRSGLVAQPVNTVSSLAYVVAGAVLVAAVARGRLPAPTAVLAVAVAAAGVGSVAFHADGGQGAVLAHDLGLLAVLAYLAGWYLGRAAGRRSPSRTAAGTCLAWTAACAPLLVPRVAATTALATAALAAGSVAAGWGWRRHRAAPVDRPLAVLALVAVAAWRFGRTGGALCDPASPLQLHAVWHVLTAVLVVAWARRTSLLSAGRVVPA